MRNNSSRVAKGRKDGVEDYHLIMGRNVVGIQLE